MEAFAYFPSLVYRDEKPEWVSQLRDSLTPYFDRAAANTEQQQTKVPLVQTELVHQDRNFEPLVTYLYEAANLILRDQGYLLDRYDLHLTALWGQRMLPGGGTDVHVHKNSHLTGWVFLETPENGAYPIFKDPRYGKGFLDLDYEDGEEIKPATSVVNFNNVQPGTILIANSWLAHQVISGGSEVPTTAMHFIISCREKGPACCIR